MQMIVCLVKILLALILITGYYTLDSLFQVNFIGPLWSIIKSFYIIFCCTSDLEKEIIIFAFSGIVGFFFEYKSLQMVPPSIVSILRTTEIVVAYVMNIVLTNSTPEIINSFGSILVLVAAIVLIFEKEIDKSVSYLCSRQKYEKLDEENNVINDKVN